MKQTFLRFTDFLKRHFEADATILLLAFLLTVCAAKLYLTPSEWYTQTNNVSRIEVFSDIGEAPLFLPDAKSTITAFEYPTWCSNSCLLVYPALKRNVTTQTFTAKIQRDGPVRIVLRGPYLNENGETQKASVVFESLKINGRGYLSIPVTVWHDDPYKVYIFAQKGDFLTVTFTSSIPPLSLSEVRWGAFLCVFSVILAFLGAVQKKTDISRRLAELLEKFKQNKIVVGLTASLAVSFLLSLFIPHLSPLFLFFLSVSAYYLCFCLLKSAYRLLNVRLEPYQKKTIFVIFALTVLAYLCSVLCYDRIYVWDATAYFDHQNSLLNDFNFSVAVGLKQILQSIWYWDYNKLICLLLNAPYQLLPTPTNNQYVLIYAVLAVLPVQFWIVVANIVIGNLCNFKYRKQFFYTGCLLACAFPVLHLSAFRGQPDIIGLVFCLPCFLLTLEYDFKRLDVKRLTFMLVLGALAFLMRRWYIYSVVSWFPVYGLYCLVSVKSKEEFKAVLKNEAVFALSSIVSVSLLLHPMLKHIFEADYGKYYSGWLFGGFAYEYATQVKHVGYIALIFMLFASVTGIIKRNKAVIISTVSFFLAIALFIQVQSILEHHLLLLMPNYFLLLFYGVGTVLDYAGKYEKAVCAAFVAYVCCNAVFPFFYQNSAHLFPLFEKGFARVMNKKDIRAVSDFILSETAAVSDVYILTTTATYQPEHFRKVYYGMKRHVLNSMIQEPIDVLGSRPFPTTIFTGKYMIVLSPFEVDEKLIVVNKIYQAFMQVKNRQYELIKEFKFEDGVTFSVYKRVHSVDWGEIDAYRKAFEPLSQKFPELYKDVFDSFKPSNSF